MDRARNLMELPPRARELADAAQRREADAVVSRLRAAHPQLPPELISELVEEAFIELQDAPVQAFRAILAERSVRRRLHSIGEAGP